MFTNIFVLNFTYTTQLFKKITFMVKKRSLFLPNYFKQHRIKVLPENETIIHSMKQKNTNVNIENIAYWYSDQSL